MIRLGDKFKKYQNSTQMYKTILEKYKNNIIGIDHIAFRSLYKNSNKFDNNFIIQKEEYNFSEYNVKANWYKNKEDNKIFNRIFNSYYLPDDWNRLSMIMSLENYNFGDLYTYSDYQHIHKENQYVAWTMLHKNSINHVAFQVDNIEKLVERMKQDDYKFNIANNEILNISPDKKLIQASTTSCQIKYYFKDGYHDVPYTFVEFVQRIDGREGFAETNANKIMHSTKK